MRHLLLWTLLLLSPALYAGEEWEFLYEKDGIKVYRQDTKLPSFKAKGRLEANLFELLAIMADVERRIEWIANLTEVKIVEGNPEEQVVVYSRFDLPWPADDRDSVMEVNIAIDYAKQEVKVAFEGAQHDSRPPVDGVVRVPHLKGHTYIKYIDDKHVEVEQVGAMDPGGNLPLWIVKMVAEDQPVNTLKAMKAHLEKTRGQYAEFIARHQAAARKATRGTQH